MEVEKVEKKKKNTSKRNFKELNILMFEWIQLVKKHVGEAFSTTGKIIKSRIMTFDKLHILLTTISSKKKILLIFICKIKCDELRMTFC